MVTRRVARVWPGNNVSNILVNLRCCTGPFFMEDMRLFPDMRVLYVLYGWIVRITYDAFSASKSHRSDPRSTDSEKTWVSNSSIATCDSGSVGTSKVPCNFWWSPSFPPKNKLSHVCALLRTTSEVHQETVGRFVAHCQRHWSIGAPIEDIGKGRYVIRLPWRPLKRLVCILLSCLAARSRLNKLVRAGSKSSNSRITKTTY